MMQLDLFGDEEAQASSDLKKISELAEKAVQLEADIEQLEEHKKRLIQQLNDIKTHKLPESMSLAGIESFSLSDGRSIKIVDFCSGSLPKDIVQREKALNWLVENGGAAIIKTDIELEFGRNEHNLATSVVEELKQRGYHPSVATGVHPSTLQAFAREKLRSGDNIDLDLLGLYAGRIAKIGGRP